MNLFGNIDHESRVNDLVAAFLSNVKALSCLVEGLCIKSSFNAFSILVAVIVHIS